MVSYNFFACSCPVFSTFFEDFSPLFILASFVVNLIDYISIGLFLGTLFCSIDLCVCFCVSIILFWLLYLCNSLKSGRLRFPTSVSFTSAMVFIPSFYTMGFVYSSFSPSFRCKFRDFSCFWGRPANLPLLVTPNLLQTYPFQQLLLHPIDFVMLFPFFFILRYFFHILWFRHWPVGCLLACCSASTCIFSRFPLIINF